MIRGSVAYKDVLNVLSNDGEDAAKKLRSGLKPAERLLLDQTMQNRREAFEAAAISPEEKRLKIKHGSHGIKKVNPSMYRLADKPSEVKLPKHVDKDTVD
jgi:hypothetical protein